MDINYFNPGNYDSDKHWHVDFFDGTIRIEATAFQRLNSEVWDVFFNDFKDDKELAEIFHKSDVFKDATFGVYLFSCIEEEASDRFHSWVTSFLLPRKRNNLK